MAPFDVLGIKGCYGLWALTQHKMYIAVEAPQRRKGRTNLLSEFHKKMVKHLKSYPF